MYLFSFVITLQKDIDNWVTCCMDKQYTYISRLSFTSFKYTDYDYTENKVVWVLFMEIYLPNIQI